MNTQDKAREVIADFVNGQVFYDHRDAVVGADTILSALTSAGLCIVPVEPTQEMIEAGAGMCDERNADADSRRAHGVYFSMLKASGAIK